MAEYRKRTLRGVSASADYLVLVARARAPQSKRTPGRRANAAPVARVEAIRAGENRQRRGDVGAAITAINFAGSPEAAPRGTPKLSEFTFRVKPTFRGKPQRRAGEIVEPSSVFTRKGQLVSGGAHQPGTLKRSIRVVKLAIEGNKAVARVMSLAPYSKPVEYGSRHRGGRNKKGRTTQLRKQPFMRPAMNFTKHRLKDPATFKG